MKRTILVCTYNEKNKKFKPSQSDYSVIINYIIRCTRMSLIWSQNIGMNMPHAGRSPPQWAEGSAAKQKTGIYALSGEWGSDGDRLVSGLTLESPVSGASSGAPAVSPLREWPCSSLRGKLIFAPLPALFSSSSSTSLHLIFTPQLFFHFSFGPVGKHNVCSFSLSLSLLQTGGISLPQKILINPFCFPLQEFHRVALGHLLGPV